MVVSVSVYEDTMVYKKYIVNKGKSKDFENLKSHQSLSGELLPLSQQVSLKDSYEKGKKQVWMVLIPILDVLILNISLVFCYVVELSKDIIPALPYIPSISQIGNKEPSSYIFTFGMTTSSLSTFLIVFFRHKQVAVSHNDCSNTVSATVGYLAAVSRLLVGAFRYHSQFKWLHYSTFISYVIFSYVYITTQVFLTYYTKTLHSTAVLLTRFIIAMLMVVFGGLFCVIKLPQYEKLNQPPYNVAQLAQWIYWTLLNIYTLTFTFDFTRIRVSWNIRTSTRMHQQPSDNQTTSEEYSHELYCAGSDNSFSNHVLIGRHGSPIFGIPIELTTKV